MSWKKIFILGSLGFASSSFALIEQTIDERHPIEAVFSKTSHNRISIENGAVENIFGNGSYFTINVDPATGNAFVNVYKDIGEKPQTLTVVSSSGAVQDILVRSSEEGPTEQILLKEKDEAEWLVRPVVSHNATMEMLDQISEGKVTSGYGLREMEEGDGLKLPDPLQANILKVLEGPFEVIRVYEIQNLGNKPVVLSKAAIKKEGDSWVFLNSHEIQEGQKTLCLVGQGKD